MSVNKSEKQELFEKLNMLLKKQSLFQQEINELQRQIVMLKVAEEKVAATPVSGPIKHETFGPVTPVKKEIPKISAQPTISERIETEIGTIKNGISSEMEKFIGENLINKIGIAVLIIGVGIGTKYAIDNNLISPLVRIILGFLVGFLLNFFAYRTKKKYFNFSAVLASGAMAIHYFISYAAYTYYQLIPNNVTFGLMVLCTVITVWLALLYNRQVLAYFGLVGAYVVPFILAQPDSSIIVLLVYMTLINCGILFISTKKRWKITNYLAFIATWVIFISWFASSNYNEQISISLTFSSIFFLIFYLVFLSYKLILKEKLRYDDIIFLLLNTGVFYFIGLISLEINNLENQYAGLFTIVNAIIHTGTAYLIYLTEKDNKKLFYWTVAIVITFFTISIPIQFNGNITAIAWAVIAVGFYYFGRTKNIRFYEIASYFILSIVFFALAFIWLDTSYNFYGKGIKTMHPTVINFDFLTSLIVIVIVSVFPFYKFNMANSDNKSFGFRSFFNYAIPLLLMLMIYFTFYTEISLYWNNIQIQTCFEQNSDGVWIKQVEKLNQDIFRFKSIWLINYSLLFATLISFINYRWFKNLYLAALNLVLNGILIIIFLGTALTFFAELRESLLIPNLNPDFDASIFHIIIRYISFLFFAVLLYTFYKFLIPILKQDIYKIIFEVGVSVVIVIICSSELVNILSLTGSEEVYKHGLTVLWGILSFTLVGYGIWRKNKYIRITAISLFAITLLKLFVYDLSNFSTIQKTIAFVLVGALLLVVSFMYNKYRKLIFEND